MPSTLPKDAFSVASFSPDNLHLIPEGIGFTLPLSFNVGGILEWKYNRAYCDALLAAALEHCAQHFNFIKGALKAEICGGTIKVSAR